MNRRSLFVILILGNFLVLTLGLKWSRLFASSGSRTSKTTLSSTSSGSSSSSSSLPIPEEVNKKKLPVTVISGFLGSGKTTLLKHILQSDHRGAKYAVIVNDMSEINIDDKLVKPYIKHQEEKLVEMSNGCICCTLREDLLQEVTKLAQEGRYDHLIIESTGVSEPLPVAETFTFRTDNSSEQCLFDIAEIDTMVTVVDAANFITDMATAEELSERGIAVNDEDTRTLTDLLVSQIEFADVILINKIDKVSVRQFNKINQIVRSLNADAAILSSVNSNINIEEIINAKKFDFERTSQSPAWIRAINSQEEKIPETEEYGIASFVYRARQPFHPLRLWSFVQTYLNQENVAEKDFGIHYPVVLRSKGFFWLASRPTEMLIWSQAGGLFQLSPGGTWIADSPEDIATEAREQQSEVDWSEEYGDRRQELVFIGTNIDFKALSSALDLCLLTKKELKQGAEKWIGYEDNFPETANDFLDIGHEEEFVFV